MLCIGSVFEISKVRFIVMRTVHLIIWLIIGISSAFITDPSPYNVYTSSIDINNGHTCSLFTTAKVDLDTTIVLSSAGMAIFGGNIFAWYLFMRKFSQIIQFTTSKKAVNDTKKNDEFYRVIREQTLKATMLSAQTIRRFSENLRMPRP